MQRGKSLNDVNIWQFYWSFSEWRRGKHGSERNSHWFLSSYWSDSTYCFFFAVAMYIYSHLYLSLWIFFLFRTIWNLYTSARFSPNGKCPWSARVSDDCIAVCSKPFLPHVLRSSLVFKFLVQGQTITAGSKHIKGSKESCLLEQDKTSNSSGLSPLSGYKTTLKQQLNGQKGGKIKLKTKQS